MPEPSPKREPIELDAAFDRGATFRGQPVSLIKMRFADGRKVTLEPADLSLLDEDSGLSAPKQRIMRVLRESLTPLTRKVVALKLRLKSDKGRFGSDVRELVSEGRIAEMGEEITDDPKNFPDMT